MERTLLEHSGVQAPAGARLSSGRFFSQFT